MVALLPNIKRFSKVFSIILVLIWFLFVIYISTKHELWRDEVRVLYQVRQASSPFDIYKIIEFDGHPVLWFLVIYAGSLFFKSPLVLPILAIAVSLLAVILFVFYSPFPWWIKTLFIFCALPLYEYTVMVRDYGLTMLLLFGIATQYRHKEKRPFIFALLLFLLANTTVQAAILAGLILFIWIYDIFRLNPSNKSFGFIKPYIIPILFVLIGILICIVFAYPRENSIVTSFRSSLTLNEFIKASFSSLVRPDLTFSKILPQNIFPWVNIGIIFLAIIGLANKPELLLAAISSQVAFGILFKLVYPGGYRHEGLFLVFLVFLYWILLDIKPKGSNITQKLLNIGLYSALVILIITNIFVSYQLVSADINGQRSSSKSFGTFLNQSIEYKNAILIPEPDYLLESLPYYATNQIYLVREHRFGNTVSWTTDAAPTLSMATLLNESFMIKKQYNKPVLIVLGHMNIDPTIDGKIKYSYNKKFTWTSDDYQSFVNSTTLIATFDSSISSEDYAVYLVK